MSKNTNLNKAKKRKNDEFYTRIEDIENELKHYCFEGEVVLCNCDNPKYSDFWKYFHLNFNRLGLKKLISIHFVPFGTSYKMEYYGEQDENIMSGYVTPLGTNGDFRYCTDVLEESTIVVTNPPFSLACKYFIPLLFKYNKRFIIVGSLGFVSVQYVFPFIRENRMRAGYTTINEFLTEYGEIRKFNNVLWWTNLDVKRREYIKLTEKYDSTKYQKYDNYDAINVNKVSEIPLDYYGVMGVPITFISRFNPEQFEIIGITNSGDKSESVEKLRTDTSRRSSAFINGKEIFKRLLIKRVSQESSR